MVSTGRAPATVESVVAAVRNHGGRGCYICGTAGAMTTQDPLTDEYRVTIACRRCRPRRRVVIRIPREDLLYDWKGALDGIFRQVADPFPLPRLPRALAPIAPPRTRGRFLPSPPGDRIVTWLMPAAGAAA